MKFITSFYGVRAGEIYPEHFEAGDECPDEMLDAAISVQAVDAPAAADGEQPDVAAKTGKKK